MLDTEKDLNDRWIDLYDDDDAPSLQPDMFADALANLGTLLETRPDAMAETVVLLERQFAGLTQRTWVQATNDLRRYAGTGVAGLVNWLTYQNTEARLAMMDRLADARVAAYLRSILARFWDELNTAQLLLTNSKDDWNRIDKYVLYETLGGSYRCSVILTKTTGEVVTLEMTADSLMNLTRHLMLMIASLASPENFSQERRNAFLEQLMQVYAFLVPSESSQDGSVTDT